jgi:uncharacterized protein YqgC (DUF456 family)
MVLPPWALPAALAAMFIGLLGVFLPVVPGVGLIWIVALVYALAEEFATIDPATFAVLSALGVIGITSDLWTSQVGATAGGASWKSMLVGIVGATVGGLVGLLFFGVGAIPGAILGALLCVVLMEWRQGRSWEQAGRAAGGWLLGCLLSSFVQAAIAVGMIGIFAWQALSG